MSLVEKNLEAYLTELASQSPAPGGGSAAALCGAQGAGLLAMVALFTLKSKKWEDRRETVQAVAEKCEALRRELTQQIDADADSFNLVAAAFQLPKGTPEEKAARSEAIQAGTLEAARVPMATMTLALEALRQGEALAAGFNTNAASDLGVASLNLLTAVKGAWLNVSINCASLKDRTVADILKAKGRTMVEEAQALADKISLSAARAI